MVLLTELVHLYIVFKKHQMKNFTFLLKISFLLIVFSLVTYNVSAETITTNVGSQTQLQLLSSSELNLMYMNRVGSINTDFVNMEGKDYVKLVVASYTKSTVYGDPEVPVRRKLIEIPHGATPVVQIINYDVSEYNLADYGVTNQILPLQFSVPKCGDAPEFICNNAIYEIDAFINQELVTVDVLGIMRGTNIARVNISPVFYNPVKNTIRVYENLEFEIVFEGADLALTQSQKEKYYSPYFNDLFQMLENYSKPANRENFTQYPIKYVIVSDPQFESQLQPFIEWKTRKGFTVVEAYTDVIGTTKSEIKTYIQGLYDAGTPEDPAPSFVLFVGDVGQIPVYENGNGETDRLYFEYTGDLFPEIFYGRFSAQNAAQLQPYIDKTLQYEQYTMPDPSYLEEVVMIAGVDSGFGHSHGNGQINYGTINYFNEDHDILSHTYLYPESGSSAAQIRQDISDGVTFANYTAHCSPSGWADPSFVTSHIPALQNQDKYGLLIGNCCSSSEFAGTCFAEEILRAENKGAVGYIGGSNSTMWDEDYYFGVGYGVASENPPPYEETGLGNYDRSFHDHGEEFGEWFTAMDQVVYAGNFAVSESGSGMQTYYWDIYNLMGDPSLMIYYGIPDVMPITHADVIMFGQTTTSVDAVPYAYISITMDNVIRGVALADENGHADIELEAFLAPGEAEIVVTAQNYQPYIASIEIMQDGVYAQFEADDLDICAGNSVNFTDQSSGANTSWDWVFEGGTPSTYSGQTPPPIVYENTGVFDVSLTVSDGTDTDSETKTDYITVVENVYADFDADIINGTAPLTVHFSDISSNAVTSWEWDFGDGGWSGLQNPTYSYYLAGTYTVSLTVEGNGCENTVTKEDFIVVEASAPLADFTAEPTSGVLPLTVNFSDVSEGEIDTWLWEFGDGNTSSEQHPEYIFTECDDYTITLTVSGPGGSEAITKEDYIEVKDILSAILSASTEVLCHGESAQLFTEVLGGSGVYTYSWTSEPEGFTSSEQNPVVSPEATTIYFVEVSDGDQVVNGEIEITVNSIPEITLGDWPDQLCNEQEPPIQLTATPEGGIYSGNSITTEGIFTSEEAPLGWNVITYTYEDENGCENSVQDSIYVDQCVQFNEIDHENNFISIYPNPFNDIINIKTSYHNLDIKILTLDGRIIETLSLIDKYTVLNLSHLKTGIYIVYVRDNEGIKAYRKIIKK